jgi:hypothetical protein
MCSAAPRTGEKEAAMLELKRQRLLAKLRQTDASLRKTPAKDPGTVERRIGRWLGRYPAAERLVIATVRSMDVVLPVREAASNRAAEVRLRIVARPEREVAILLQSLSLELPSLPKRIEDVVQKNAP